MRPIRAARLSERACAISSSTAQNSGSTAIEVAWPESWIERFLKLGMAGNLGCFAPARKRSGIKMTGSASFCLHKIDGGVFFSPDRRNEADSMAMPDTAQVPPGAPAFRPMSTKLDLPQAL